MKTKKIIDKRLKYIAISVSIFILCVFLFVECKEAFIPKMKELSIPLYRYQSISDVSYKVYLKPNLLNTNNIENEGKTYITNYTNNIKTRFSYTFQGEKVAPIKGTYEIIVQVEGYTIEKEIPNTVWIKNFTLLPKTKFNENKEKISLVKDVSINLNDYNSFANRIIQDSKINTFVKLTLAMKVIIEVKTQDGIIKKDFGPSVAMPINVPYYSIIKDNLVNKQDSLQGKVKIKVPPNSKLLITLGILILLLILILIYAVVFLNGVDMSRSLKKAVNKIFKNHGNRLVALSGDVIEDNFKCIKVRSIDDLVKISDEIGKPILYKYSESYEEINAFFVLDNEKVYKFLLEDFLRGTNKSKLAEEKIQIESLEV